MTGEILQLGNLNIAMGRKPGTLYIGFVDRFAKGDPRFVTSLYLRAPRESESKAASTPMPTCGVQSEGMFRGLLFGREPKST